MNTTVIFLTGILLSACGTDKNSNSNVESSMFGLKKTPKNYVIASPLEGVLMQNGEPLADTKITRLLRWNGNDGAGKGLSQDFFTDSKGKFSLPIHEEMLTLGLAQFVGKTELTVETSGNTYDVWYNNKFTPEILADTGGEILTNLICDLSFEEEARKAGMSTIMSVCHWDNMPEPK